MQQPPSDYYKKKTQMVMDEFRKTDFKSEIVPIDAHNAATIFRDPTFWVVFALGILPLLITSMQDGKMQLSGLLFFFAMLWGGIFRGLVLKSSDSLIMPVVAFFFTGMIGMTVLLAFYSGLPKFYMEMADSSYHVVRLLGFVFQVGIWEELCKIVPVVLYLAYKRKNCSPNMILLIGVFSGLGFAAFENMHYSTMSIYNTVERTVSGAQSDGAEGLVKGIASGVHGAMVTVLLRSMSLAFAHALWTGIFSYYLAMAVIAGNRWYVLCLLGLLVPAVLHGFYDWFCGLQPAFAAGIIAVSFVLFYGYLSKIRNALANQEAKE